MIRSAILVVFGLLLGACASNGISENLDVATASTPLVGEVQAARDQSEAILQDALLSVIAVPLEIIFNGRLPGGEGSATDATPAPLLDEEERLAQRRHALGLPDNAERRLAERQAARRREMELGAARAQ